MYIKGFSHIVSSNRFDENSDISTTYLGKVESKGTQDKLRAEESFPISEWLHFMQIIRWYEMSVSIGHRHQQILYVKVILYAV